MRLANVLLAASSVLVLACSGDGTGPDPADRVVASVQITPGQSSVKYPGEVANYTAVALNASNAPVSGATITWTVDDANVATLAATGGTATTTAAGFGQTTLTATADGVSGKATFRVTGETSLAFLEGSWSVSGTVTVPGGATALVAGASAVELYPGGRVLVETLRLTQGDGEAVEISQLHAPVGQTGQWMTVRADSYLGAYSITTGSFSPGVTTLSSGSRFTGGSMERTVLDEQSGHGFRLRILRSEDGGTTWSAVWELMYERDEGVELPAGPRAPTMACAESPHGAFDYWVGKWRVESPRGTASGSNTVESVGGGCAVQENWRGLDGSIGVSLSGYDSRRERWTQVYLDSGGGTLELTGGPESGVMTLRGDRGNVNDRISWIPQDDGVVRQLWETSTSGAPYGTLFDGYYIPEG